MNINCQLFITFLLKRLKFCTNNNGYFNVKGSTNSNKQKDHHHQCLLYVQFVTSSPPCSLHQADWHVVFICAIRLLKTEKNSMK